MKFDLDFVKKYGWLVLVVGYLGLGQYFEGLQPIFRFQLDAHAQEVTLEMAQTNKKLDNFACLQIVMEYLDAKKVGDTAMMAYWAQQASTFNCTLPG